MKRVYLSALLASTLLTGSAEAKSVECDGKVGVDSVEFKLDPAQFDSAKGEGSAEFKLNAGPTYETVIKRAPGYLIDSGSMGLSFSFLRFVRAKGARTDLEKTPADLQKFSDNLLFFEIVTTDSVGDPIPKPFGNAFMKRKRFELKCKY